MLKMSTIGRNARVQTFAKVVDSFVDRCLWQVIKYLKSSQICCFYNVNKHVGSYDMTSTVTSFAQ